jgi:hypothetical protein
VRAAGRGAAGLVVAAAAATFVLAASAGAASNVTCKSGKTDFQRAGVRAFEVRRVFESRPQEGSRYTAYYVCRRGNRHPFQYWGEPFSRNESTGDFQLLDGRLAFIASSEGVSGGAETAVGWVRVPGGPEKLKPVYVQEGLTAEEEEQSEPKIPDEEVEYRLAPDGSIALAGEGENQFEEVHGHPAKEWEVALFSYKGGRLSPPKALLTTQKAAEAPVLKTIAISATTVSWTNRSGATVSVPR